MNEETRKDMKTMLFNFRNKCRGKMSVLDSMLALRNQDFEEMFEELVNKFRKSEVEEVIKESKELNREADEIIKRAKTLFES